MKTAAKAYPATGQGKHTWPIEECRSTMCNPNWFIIHRATHRMAVWQWSITVHNVWGHCYFSMFQQLIVTTVEITLSSQYEITWKLYIVCTLQLTAGCKYSLTIWICCQNIWSVIDLKLHITNNTYLFRLVHYINTESLFHHTVSVI
jgi:hypothetical protein